MQKVEIFTDGACKGNPGPGGWGALLRFHRDGKIHEKQLYGGQPDTTNNRMEMQAIVEALHALKQPCQVSLTTDSRYVQQGFEQWLSEWKKNNWRTKSKQPVKNKDLWQLLEKAVDGHQMEWHWVKGHSGHEGNHIADALANRGVATITDRGED